MCSGSQPSLIDQAPSEASKYAGIGATIFFTGIFASLASAYAIYTFTDNAWISTWVGIVWGLMIFNLDRYIVSSMRKTGSPKKEWIMALPRIVLAIIISLVIARPLELKIFEKEIATELMVMNDEIARARKDSVSHYYEQRMSIEQSAITQLQIAIDQKQQQRDELRSLATAEADGTGGTMRRNAGPIYQIKKAQADKIETELSVLRAGNHKLIEERRLEQALLRQQKTKALATLAAPSYNGFAARLDALGRLTSKNSSIFLANLFILLLFIALETAPVLVKLISSRGPYDYLLAAEEYKFEINWLVQKAKIHHKTRRSTSHLNSKDVEHVEQYLSTNLTRFM